MKKERRRGIRRMAAFLAAALLTGLTPVSALDADSAGSTAMGGLKGLKYLTAEGSGAAYGVFTSDTGPDGNVSAAFLDESTGELELFMGGSGGVNRLGAGGTGGREMGRMEGLVGNVFALGGEDAEHLAALVKTTIASSDGVSSQNNYFVYLFDGAAGSWKRAENSELGTPTSTDPNGNTSYDSRLLFGLVMAQDDIWASAKHWDGKEWKENALTFNSFYKLDQDTAYGAAEDGNLYRYSVSSGKWNRVPLGDIGKLVSITGGCSDQLVLCERSPISIFQTSGPKTYRLVNTETGAVSRLPELPDTTGTVYNVGLAADGSVYALLEGQHYIKEGSAGYIGTDVYQLQSGQWTKLTIPVFQDPAEDDDPDTKIRPDGVRRIEVPAAGVTMFLGQAGANYVLYSGAAEASSLGLSSTDPLYEDKSKAIATLKTACSKYEQTDYSAENWTALTAERDKGLQAIREATASRSVYDRLNAAIDAMGAVTAQRAGTVTIAVSMDRNTLGQGFLIEPELVEVTKGTKASTVITELLSDKYSGVSGAPAQPWKMTGSVDDSFYLASVYDPNHGEPSFPQFILTAVGGMEKIGEGTADWLGEFDYYQQSGWMYSVGEKDNSGNQFPGMGASGWRLSDGEVMRWQFTVYGYGADLNQDNTAWGQGSIVSLGNKDALTWAVAVLNSMYKKEKLTGEAAYAEAVSILTNPEAPQTAIDAAMQKLKAAYPGVQLDGNGVPQTSLSARSGFPDVKAGDWFYECVTGLAKDGLIKGNAAGSFLPQSPISRAEFVQLLYNLSKAGGVQTGNADGQTADAGPSSSSSSSSSTSFRDVAAGSWYGDAVTWAAGSGVAAGEKAADGTLLFRPDDPISRQDMAVMIAAYLDKAGVHGSSAGQSQAAADAFADAAAAADYAAAAVDKMQAAGIISGQKGEGGQSYFLPQAQAARAEAASMLWKLYQK
ncbi:S-layer homology domain-containing protein [Bacilliculturomica massiliensis]|uniref:S-layer homology domain-containing protein n=1 Tax=Bacilliculturomica massiliensis TaxID=1917867 RepID=UPI0010311BCF|nr:S-layer homology domain-containing protein [Bacilliculturomica massiliensis]